MCHQLIMDKQLCGLNNKHVVSSHNGILGSSKKERSSDTCHDTDEP